jgi:hypothetical protein
MLRQARRVSFLGNMSQSFDAHSSELDFGQSGGVAERINQALLKGTWRF